MVQESNASVVFMKTSTCATCYIEVLSEQLKRIIRDRLSGICHGASKEKSGSYLYSYQSTLSEFLIRYEKKPPSIQKGLIGELLTHVIISEMFPEYTIVTPFFNLEERSVKKGFDLILTTTSAEDIWITEVKSGELHKNKSEDTTISELLYIAKDDLLQRLSSNTSTSLWLNSINDAKIVLERYPDVKEVVVKLLEGYGEKTIDKSAKCENFSVFLSGVLYAPTINRFCHSSIENTQEAFSAHSTFNQVFILAIQKNTYKKVYDFLKSEATECQSNSR